MIICNIYPEYNNGKGRIDVMSNDGIYFAGINYFYKEKHNMWIYNLKVDIDYRKHGCGKQIMNYLIDYAKEVGCKYLYLSVKANSFMHDWYLRLGFKEYTKNDGFIKMYKEL